MKWACCGMDDLEKARFEKFQAALAKNGAVEMQILEWPGVFDGFGHVRWGEKIQLEASRTFTVQSSWSALLGVGDGMVMKDGRWWPLCASYEALCQMLVELGKGLDLGSSAFISGSGSSAKIALAALFKCGFRQFRIVSEKSEEMKTLVKEAKTHFFGVDLDVLLPEDIVMQSAHSGVFVNTLPESENLLLQELSYLNFLKRPGAVIHTALFTQTPLLLKEAIDSAIPTIDAWKLAARADALWAKWAFSQTLDETAYLEALKTDVK